MTLTPRAAQAIQDRITATSGWVMWFLSEQSPKHPGKAVAWAMVPDQSGGRQEGGELVADTLEELRAMLPRGVSRQEGLRFLPPEVCEVWD